MAGVPRQYCCREPHKLFFFFSERASVQALETCCVAVSFVMQFLFGRSCYKQQKALLSALMSVTRVNSGDRFASWEVGIGVWTGISERGD